MSDYDTGRGRFGGSGGSGADGRGITSITLTDGDHTPGTFDTYTITLTDGTEVPFQVYNGADGASGGGGGSSAVVPRVINTGSTATMLESDNGKTLIIDRPGLFTLTIPPGLSDYHQTTILRRGLGSVVVAAGAGVTWVPDDDRKSIEPVGGMIYTLHVGSNAFIRTGGLV